jgi:hypothetical protein
MRLDAPEISTGRTDRVNANGMAFEKKWFTLSSRDARVLSEVRQTMT